MMRKLFTFLASLSLLLCLTLVVIRIRSESTQDLISRTKDGRRIEFRVEKDVLYVQEYVGWPVEEPWTWLSSKVKLPLGPLKHSYSNNPQVEVYLDSKGRPVGFGSGEEVHLSNPMTYRTLLYAHFTDWILLMGLLPGIWISIWLFQLYQRTRRAGRGFQVEPAVKVSSGNPDEG